jgi:spore coat polysaccharide biosynthesis protein SpsF
MRGRFKTVIIVQARMGSSRFPGKVLEDVAGRPMLVFQYERLSRSLEADLIVVATTTSPLDDKVESLCDQFGIPCFRGSEQDVLLRYRDAAEAFEADAIVRINADCPFIDPVEVDRIIKAWHNEQPGLDYASNILEETFPMGMHIEIFSRTALNRAESNAFNLEEREHVTPYIYRNPSLFQLYSITNLENLSHFRWTVDYQEDLEFVRKVVEVLAPNNQEFGMMDVVNLLNEYPRLMNINSQYKKSQNLL